jgi:hypothetical protein
LQIAGRQNVVGQNAQKMVKLFGNTIFLQKILGPKKIGFGRKEKTNMNSRLVEILKMRVGL